MGVTDKTYTLHSDEKRIYGYSSGKESVEQAIYKILATERFAWDIYSEYYGNEVIELYGKSKDTAISEIELKITDALTHDERIIEVGDFEYEETKSGLFISFKVKTDSGTVSITKEVN